MADRKSTRIQLENRKLILAGALDVFARNGFRGATVDEIARAAGMSKPNLLYYFPTKDQIYRTVLEGMLDAWLDPLRALDANGEPTREITAYITRKIELARDYPTESRLFANEIGRGAPILRDVLQQDLKPLVDEKAAILRRWSAEGKIVKIDPYHLIFAIWATTQHYADFDVQVRTVLGLEGSSDGHFHDAATTLTDLFLAGLKPR